VSLKVIDAPKKNAPHKDTGKKDFRHTKKPVKADNAKRGAGKPSKPSKPNDSKRGTGKPSKSRTR
jgi:ATP-dependent RNA helicase RhlE